MEQFERRLSESDFVLVKYDIKKWEIKYMLVVYYSIIDDKLYQIFRVDMAHGFLHKDKLFERRPERVKEEIFEKPTVELVWRIVREIQETWQEMRKSFIRNKFGDRK